MNNNQAYVYTSKKADTPIRRSDVIIAQILSLLLSFFIPIGLFMNISAALFQTLTIACGVLSILIISKLTHSTRTTVSFSFFLVVIFTLFGGSIVFAAVAAFAGSICTLACSLIKADNAFTRAMAFSPALIAYLGAAALLGSFVLSIPALLHLPVATVLAYCFSKRVSRVSTICRTSGIMIIMALSPAVIFYFLKYGSDLSVLPDIVESGKTALANLLYDSVDSVLSLSIPEAESVLSMVDLRELSEYAAKSVFYLLPAIVVTLFNLIAFALQSMLISILVHGEKDKEKIIDMVAFDMTPVSAIVFVISLFVTLILSAEDFSVWSVTAENIAIILMPGLLFTAFAALRAFVFTKRSSCIMVLLYIGSIMMIFYAPTIMIPLASFAGAVLIILNTIARYRAKRKK